MTQQIDYLQSIGISALGTRLRRLFESLNGAVTQLYREELGFEQRWFAMTLLLEDRGAMSVKSVAEALGTSHVSVLQVAKAMETEGLLERSQSHVDGRVVLLSLSSKGIRTAGYVHEISQRVDKAASALLKESAPDFIENLTKLENAIRDEPFADRLVRTTHVGATKRARSHA